MFLIGDYTNVVFKVTNAAANKYDRLRAEQAVSFCQFDETMLPGKWSISLLNVRSLRKHFDKIPNTSSLIPTEGVRLKPNSFHQGGLNLTSTMGGFYVTCNSSDDRFCSLALQYCGNPDGIYLLKTNNISFEYKHVKYVQS